jgi:hypothetical protein
MTYIARANLQYAPKWYKEFLELVPGDDLLTALTQNKEEMLTLFDSIPPAMTEHRYAPNKWTIKQAFIHISDEERYFSYKAFCYSRRAPAHLEVPMGEDYNKDFNADNFTMEQIREDLIAVRHATITLFQTMTDDMLDFNDLPSHDPYCARSLGWFAVGHNIHHLNIIRTKYLT